MTMDVSVVPQVPMGRLFSCFAAKKVALSNGSRRFVLKAWSENKIPPNPVANHHYLPIF